MVLVVQQPCEVQLRGVVEGPSGGLAEQGLDHVRLSAAVGLERIEDGALGGREQAVEAPQHGERKDDPPVFVALVGAAQEVADPPDEVRKFSVSSDVHALFAPLRCPRVLVLLT